MDSLHSYDKLYKQMWMNNFNVTYIISVNKGQEVVWEGQSIRGESS